MNNLKQLLTFATVPHNTSVTGIASLQLLVNQA